MAVNRTTESTPPALPSSPAVPAAFAKGTNAELNFIPECSSSECLIVLAVFGITVLYLLPLVRFTVLNADEGITLQGAQRILHGQVLYRDFFGFYTPGSYYWDALVSRVFRNSVIAQRLVLIFEGAILSSLSYLLIRRTCSRAISFSTALLVCAASLPLCFYVQHSWDSSVLASMSVFVAVRLVEKVSPLRCFQLGCMVSLTTLFEQSRGAGLLLGLGLAFAFLLFHRRKAAFQMNSKMIRSFSLGLAAPLALTLLYFGFKGTAWIMIHDWFWPLHHYAITNRLPYGYIPFAIGQYEEILSSGWAWRLFYIFVGSSLFLVCALPLFGIGILSRVNFRRSEMRHKQVPLLMITFLIIGLWISVVIGRRDYQHFVYLFPLSAIFLAWILDGVVVPKSFRVLRMTLGAWAFISLPLISFSMLLAANGAPDQIHARRGTLSTSGRDDVIPYIEAHRNPGDQLFVYPYQPLYYYLTATTNPTRFDYIQPGLHSHSQVESAIQDLRANPGAPVLLSASFSEIVAIPWPSTPENVLAAPDPMSLYIVKHYHTCQALTSTTNGTWTWLYMVRMNATCPS
jgi:hypothetical protein